MRSRIALTVALAAVLSAAGALFFSTSSGAADPGLPASHWQHPLPAQGKAPAAWPALERNLSPLACAECHVEQFRAWKASKHAHAYSPGLVGQFPGMGAEEANSSCLTCHAPLAEQRLASEEDIDDSLQQLKQAPGLEHVPLRHAGVSCASCHVRGWQRFGPPRRDSSATGWQKGPAHGGFYATKDFEQSQFCAACHQFPQSAAVNGKPLENTVEEWRASPFAKQGVQCQGCHMPDRRHEFRGIHDSEMTRKGLSIDVRRAGKSAEMEIKSIWIGHAFPTYVTPRVIVEAEAVDEGDESLQLWRWDIVREVSAAGGWHEIRDTRLLPGESRVFSPGALPAATHRLVFRIRVLPDEFYKGVYRSLLASEMAPPASGMIHQALEHAGKNDYVLFEEALPFS